ncbi:SurA N-terminal domain-containing protein [Rhizobium sp. KVB221]|uniref:Parvulin-like PPIase n=1 Tax=Rhizobium setariae TaxID=2801340 RepID=A0A936YM19_9HYPH|nr:SurA N-terminal domain-containing protein [Rhizobium setariae]MBL0372989.1 SurA N-terminal domain-containing protein [Rhizobium setariae]
MLESLRKASRSWVAKGLMALLVASFGIWGVHSSMFSSTTDAVVTVGDQKVSNTEFQITFNSAMANMSRRFGQQLNLEQAKLFGIENSVISQLISGAALDQLATNMKLGLSEDRLLQLIQDDPAFRDDRGAFSRQLMEQRLYSARIRAEDYLTLKSKEAVRSQIADAIANGFEAPKTLTDALTAYADERRSIDYLILTDANIEPVQPPTADVLDKWFADNKAKYKAPEYRKITYVKLEPVDIADKSAISDDQIKQDYEKHKDTYRTPETRTIEQLTFADKASADAAAAKLAAGTAFEQLVTEQGKTATDVLLGDFTKDKMPTPAMAEAAFAVKNDDGVTPVTDGLLGPVILRVTNIRPEVVKGLDDVKDAIREQLALVLANDEIQSVYDRFEDARASGASLAEVASQLQLKSTAIDAVDATGLDPKGVDIKDLPNRDKLIAEAFKTEPGVEALPLTIDNGGYVWFEVNDITEARDRTLDEVKDRVTTDWTSEQQKLALSKKAEGVAGQLTKGAKMSDIAAELKIAVETKTGIQRGMDDAVLGTSAINAAFGGADGFVTSAPGAGGENRIILQVTEVNENGSVDALDDKSQRIKTLANAAGDDILDQLVNELQAEYGVTLNRTLASQLMVR